jgi:ABC-2 type transport system ATP-binding protein
MGRRTTAVIATAALALLAPAAASARDEVVESFDGTPLVTHFFPGEGASKAKPAPTVLVGPGWSMGGDTQTQGANGVAGAFGVSAIGTFIDAGYNVLTWDPRGFGGSGGTVQVDDPDFEGRDVSALIDYVAGQPEAQLDDPRDPRLGMAGASYGGGIQLVAAGMDPRIDAIAPTIAWNSLTTSLFQDNAIKLGWGSLLIALGVEGATLPGLGSPAGPQTGNQDPLFYSTLVDGLATGHATAEEKAFFADNGPDFLLPKVRVPTLIIQGTVDTLFPLDEAVRNFRAIDRNKQSPRHGKGVPVKMIFFCGGHGVCFTGNGPSGYVDDRTLAWFDRYLREHRKTDTGPKFAWIADDGVLRSSLRFPGKRVGALRGSGSGTLPLVPGPTGGGALIFATPSPLAVNVPIPGPRKASNALGPPKLRLTYKGTAAPASTFAYAQIVNPRNNQVMGNITTPVPLQLDGAEHTILRKLEWIAGRAPAGGGYRLQLTPTSTLYDVQRSAGAVDFSDIDVKIPLRKPIRRAKVHR